MLKNDNWKDKPVLIKKKTQKEEEKEINSAYGSTLCVYVIIVCLCYGKSRNIFSVTDWEGIIF